MFSRKLIWRVINLVKVFSMKTLCLIIITDLACLIIYWKVSSFKKFRLRISCKCQIYGLKFYSNHIFLREDETVKTKTIQNETIKHNSKTIKTDIPISFSFDLTWDQSNFWLTILELRLLLYWLGLRFIPRLPLSLSLKSVIWISGLPFDLFTWKEIKQIKKSFCRRIF